MNDNPDLGSYYKGRILLRIKNIAEKRPLMTSKEMYFYIIFNFHIKCCYVDQRPPRDLFKFSKETSSKALAKMYEMLVEVFFAYELPD